MHGLRLASDEWSSDAVALAALNSVTLLGAEVQGRSYGGGVLKLEPREAASLPLPKPDVLRKLWERLEPERDVLDQHLRAGDWMKVVGRVDEVLLRDVLGLEANQLELLVESGRSMRGRRLARGHPRPLMAATVG
jgi:hypothetical protein